MPVAITTVVEEYSDTVPEGEIIRQDPESALVRPDTDVTVYISLGPAPASLGAPVKIRVSYSSPKIHIGFS
jgi:beta-lactam-binding protein with PASTA domain